MVTHNLPGWLPLADRTSALRRLCDTADVIALQEAPWVAPLRVPPAWQALHGEDQALTVLARDKYEIVGRLERMAYPATRVGDWGAGPVTLRAGWDFGVRLRDTSGVEFWVFDAHLPPTVEVGRPVDEAAVANWEHRRRLYRREVAQLVDITSWIDVEPVVVCGDFNGTPGFDLLSPMREVFEFVTRPSHGGRAIDYIWHRNVTVTRSWEVPTASDHDAVAATLAL